MTRSLAQKESRTAALSVLPMIIVILAVTIYPTANAFYHSLTKWNGIRSSFIGLANYADIFTDHQFWRLLLNNLIYIASVPIQIILALVVTVLLFEKTPGWRLFRALFFLPNVLSAVIIGLVFKQAFMYEGPINTLLRGIGLEALALDWLSTGPTALAVVIAAVIWTNFGYGVILFLAGMSTIDTSIFEAAKLDGANWFQRTFHVILPQLSRVVEFFSVTTIIWIFTGLFGFIFSLTKGGPGYDTTPLEYMVYLKAFKAGSQMGYACALAVILLGITFLISRFQMALAARVKD